jgi:hypothetical protein
LAIFCAVSTGVVLFFQEGLELPLYGFPFKVSEGLAFLRKEEVMNKPEGFRTHLLSRSRHLRKLKGRAFGLKWKMFKDIPNISGIPFEQCLQLCPRIHAVGALEI